MSTPRPTALITGASIAGPAVAYWLHRFGWDPVLLERAPALRDAGQNIDVRGAGREVVRRMGIEDAVAAAGTGEGGTRFVDGRGRAIATFPVVPGQDGPTAELEILRGELARIVVDLTAGDVEHVYGDHVTAVRQDGDGVEVRLAGGAERRFDMLVVAEGLRSGTRDLVFGPVRGQGHDREDGDEGDDGDGGVRLRDLGMTTTYGTIPRTDADDDYWRWHPASDGRSVSLRPDNQGTTRGMLSFMDAPTGLERLDVDAQVAELQRRFADVGWEAPRVLAGFAERPDDLYVERVAQVHAPAWTDGRVALVGDAAYAPSPVSGMGTTLSFVGAYLLAGELAAACAPGGPGAAAGLAAYERRMRPIAERGQQLPPGTPRIANPRSALGGLAFRSALRVAGALFPLAGLLGRLPLPSKRDVELPDYDHLVQRP